MKGFKDFKPHHLPLGREHTKGNGNQGRVFFLPGSDGRAQRISESFLDTDVLPSDRRHNVYLGRFEVDGTSVDVGTVATGMGCPSLDIIVTELIAMGARRFIRVGTSGSLQPKTIKAGDLVIATAAVRDESVSDRYVAREYPAVANGDVIAALEKAAVRLGTGDHVFKGVIHSKDSLLAREMGYGPLPEENRAYVESLHAMGVLASEMEAAHLFILSDVYSKQVTPIVEGESPDTIKSGAILAIIGDESAFATPEVAKQTEEKAIEVALHGAFQLIHPEGKG